MRVPTVVVCTLIIALDGNTLQHPTIPVILILHLHCQQSSDTGYAKLRVGVLGARQPVISEPTVATANRGGPYSS